MSHVLRTPPWLGAVLLALAMIVPAQAQAQAVIGVVRAEADNAPIPNASVALVDADGERVRSVATDSAGAFRLEAPGSGTYRVHVAHVGYHEIVSHAIELGPVERIEIVVHLSIDAVALDPIVVTERRRYPNLRIQGFYERADWVQRSGRGRVLTREELERMRPHTLRSMLATYPMGYRMGQRCQPRVYIDGMNLGVGAEALELLDSTIHWTDVEGVEIYRGASQIPPQYGRGYDCGTVLVWSKADAGSPFTWRRALFAAGFLILMFSM